MEFSKIKIVNFRNFGFVEFEPSSEINIICGDNGSGKSSMIEAISYLCLGKSFRTNHYQSIINKDSNSFTLFGCFGENEKIGIQRTIDNKITIKLDDKPINKISYIVKRFPIQIIHPSDSYSLGIGGSIQRRKYLDWGLFYHFDDFYDIWTNFTLYLKQRNAYLKNDIEKSLLDYIDQQYCFYAEKIKDFRNQYLLMLKEVFQTIIEKFIPEYRFELHIFHGWDIKKNLIDIIKTNLSKDLLLKYTNYGPQKADLKIKANGIPVNEILSRGQIKLLWCALKIAQGLLLKNKNKQNCIYLIDDFTSELDGEKQKIFAEYLNLIDGQVFITTIEKNFSNYFNQRKICKFWLSNNQIIKG